MILRFITICYSALMLTGFLIGGDAAAGQDSTYTAEKLFFSAGFRWVSAGESSMEMRQDTLNGAVVNWLNFSTRTNSFLDKFFKIS